MTISRRSSGGQSVGAGSRKRRVLPGVLLGAIVVSLGAWGATSLVESPREAAARAEAPPPSLITVPVELRKVGDVVVTRGLVTATQTVEAINPMAGQGAARSIISGALPRPGKTVKTGSVVVEVSGRPIIALESDIPAYRDLKPGDVGSDVQRLNAALAAAGFEVDRGSRFNAATDAALRELYREAGYEPPRGLPVAEVAFMSSLPASVVTVDASLGGDVGEASIKVASGSLVVHVDFPPDQAGLVTSGAKVVISSEILGKSVPGHVGDAGSVVPDRPLPSTWAGQDVRIRVTAASTGTRVLSVPVTAVVMDGSGQTQVVVVDSSATSVADAHPHRVPIDVGVVGGGWAEVTPLNGAHLNEGDIVQLSAESAAG